MEVKGIIKSIDPTKIIGQNGFKKRELVLETNQEYPQALLIEFNQDKCDLLNSFKVGDNVRILVKLKGREWFNPEGKAVYFNSIKGWSINFENENNNPKPLKPANPNFPMKTMGNLRENDRDDGMSY